jgi:hypothetical protein
MSVAKASSTSAAQINGDSLANEIEPGQGNSSAPDRCCIALSARPPNAKQTSPRESEVSWAASAGLEGGWREDVQLKDADPFVKVALLVIVKAVVCCDAVTTRC